MYGCLMLKVASPHNCCNAQKVLVGWQCLYRCLVLKVASLCACYNMNGPWVKRQTYLFAPCWLHSTGQGSGVAKVTIQMWLLGNQHSLDFIDRSASSAVKLRVVTPPPPVWVKKTLGLNKVTQTFCVSTFQLVNLLKLPGWLSDDVYLSKL